jgi:nucleoid DNA-binding protein
MKVTDCNTELVQDVAQITGETPMQVRHALHFFTGYIAETIAEGAFETVIVPYFGKFQPKVKEIQWMSHRKGITKPTPLTPKDGTI